MSMVSGDEGELPLQRSAEVPKPPEPQLKAVVDPVDTVEPVIASAPEAGALLAEGTAELQEAMDEASVAQFLQKLNQGFVALKDLNLEGFRQVYPVFLILFGSVVVGIALSLVSGVLDSINHLPLIGGFVQGVSELIGLVVMLQFIAENLLKQQKRADLFARIVVLKKDLLGE